MTYNDIYLSALSLIGEPKDSTATVDYAHRAPKLLCAVNNRVFYLAGLFCDMSIGDIPSVTSLDDEFAFDECYAPAAAHLLGAYLVTDMDHELHSELFNIGSQMLDDFCAARTTVGPTLEVY